MLHKEILNNNQLQLLPLIQEFKRSFYLCGGTAIALQIGHRRSIDFDLFKPTSINHKQIIDKIKSYNFNLVVTRRVEEQLNIIINEVKLTFFSYQFDINANIKFENYIKMPDLLELAAMKAYALGRRAKWKDYVDLYFILNQYLKINEIVNRANEIYGELFSEKQFRAQLSYFEDIDFSEEVDYLIPVPNNIEIQNSLKNIALDIKS